MRWGWSLYWSYPFISISFLAVMKCWTSLYTGIHCEALSTQSLDLVGNLVDFKTLHHKVDYIGGFKRGNGKLFPFHLCSGFQTG